MPDLQAWRMAFEMYGIPRAAWPELTDLMFLGFAIDRGAEVEAD